MLISSGGAAYRSVGASERTTALRCLLYSITRKFGGRAMIDWNMQLIDKLETLAGISEHIGRIKVSLL